MPESWYGKIMGDFTTLLSSLNIGATNTVLLCVILFFIQKAWTRIETLEKRLGTLCNSLSFLKGTLNFKEPHD